MSNQLESNGIVGTGLIVTLTILSVIIIGALAAFSLINVMSYIYVPIVILAVGLVGAGVRIVRPTTRGVIERLGKFKRVQGPGWTWIVPGVDRLYGVNITEQMTDAEKQEIITKDKLNATVAALIRYKVMGDEESVKNSQYAVNDYGLQIVQLARTTLRNVIGTKDFADVNSERNTLNNELRTLIGKETEKWGIQIVNFEMKEIEPPKDVQATMNSVIMANNKKTAALDLAVAAKTEAEGLKNAAIERATGEKRARELNAEGEAAAIVTVANAKAKQIEVVNKAAQEFFKEGAVELKRLEVTQESLSKNSKVILTQKGITPSIILNETDDKVVPLRAD